MGRKPKHNLDYFPLDVDFFDNRKVLLIEEEHKLAGGYLAIRLMAMVYEQGYYLEWGERAEVAIARKVGNGIKSTTVIEVLQTCLSVGLFDRGLFESHRILTSRGIQERWLLVQTLTRRKPDINSAFWLISSEETPIPSEETPPPATESAQIGIESKIEKESTIPKEEKVIPETSPAPASPAQARVGNARKQKDKDPPEPFWQALVQVWFDFNKEKFGDEPSFTGKDIRSLKAIVQALKRRAEKKKVEWSEETARSRLRSYFDEAFKDSWLAAHFLLPNLETQFDKIILNHSKNGNGNFTSGGYRQGVPPKPAAGGVASGGFGKL